MPPTAEYTRDEKDRQASTTSQLRLPNSVQATSLSASSIPYDHFLKILLIGNSGVGKSSLLLRYVGEGFRDDQLPTIGVDFRVRFVQQANKMIKLAIWDTAGQERFRTLTSSYYKGAHGIILVYDVSDRESFENVTSWMQEVEKYVTQTDAVLMIVANKIDKRPDLRSCVTREEGEEFAFEHSTLFLETSAKVNEGVDRAFSDLIAKILSSPTLLRGTRPIGGSQDNNRIALDQSPLGGSTPVTSSGGGICGC